jgi:hypothetical protein
MENNEERKAHAPLNGDSQTNLEAVEGLHDAACCASSFVLNGAAGNPYLQEVGNPFVGIDGAEKIVDWYDENVEKIYESVKSLLKVPASSDLVSSSCSGESYIGQLLDSYDLREPY